jgi:hypothetical protein
MKSYTKTIQILSTSQSIRASGTQLSKVEFSSSDPTLKRLLSKAIGAIEHQIAAAGSASGTTRLLNAKDQRFVDLKKYCEDRTKGEKPEWMVTAELHGWTPPKPKN